MFSNALADRVLGQYPLSIPTSLAIESACGIHEDFSTDHAPILEYDELWINLRTLYRNLRSALPKDLDTALSPEEAAFTLIEEMELIKRIISEVNKTCVVVFYYSHYDDLDKIFKHSEFRIPSTPKQITLSLELEQALMLVLKQHPEDCIVFRNKLETSKFKKTLIITHLPIDLVWYKSFKSLVLLESHTGRIKERQHWYEKYLDGKSLPPMPFRKDLLAIFGDKETFKPAPLDLRRSIVALANEFKWTAITTTDRIVFCVDSIKDLYIRDRIKEILTHS